MYAHVHQTPPPPSARNPMVPPALDAIVLSALSKNPALRPQNAAQMKDRLSGWLASRTPPTAPRALPPPPQQVPVPQHPAYNPRRTAPGPPPHSDPPGTPRRRPPFRPPGAAPPPGRRGRGRRRRHRRADHRRRRREPLRRRQEEGPRHTRRPGPDRRPEARQRLQRGAHRGRQPLRGQGRHLAAGLRLRPGLPRPGPHLLPAGVEPGPPLPAQARRLRPGARRRGHPPHPGPRHLHRADLGRRPHVHVHPQAGHRLRGRHAHHLRGRQVRHRAHLRHRPVRRMGPRICAICSTRARTIRAPTRTPTPTDSA